MPDIIITPSTGKLEFIDNSAQTTRRHSFTLDHSDGLVLDAPLSAAAISAPLNVINVTVNNSNANYPFVLAQSGETGAKNLLMDGAGGTYNPFTNTATIDISGNSATTTLASNSTNLGGVAAASYVTLTGTQTLTNKTITGTFTGNLTGTGSWATNAVSAVSATTATNSTQLNGQAASYYTNIPARLGYTPVNQAGDTISGNLTVNGNFAVNGSVTAFSASNIYITSSNLTVTDNILLMNALSPYQRYAGIQMYDSGSGTLSQFLWDGEGDYFFLTGSSVNGKIITGPDGQTNLTSGYIPKATAGYKLGNSLIYDNGTNIGIGTTSPGAKLDVVGSVRSFSSAGNYGLITNGSFQAVGNHGGTFMLDLDNTGEADLVNIKKSGVSRFYIKNNGNIGIGTTNPSYKLEVYSGAKTSAFTGLSISNFNNYDGTAASLVTSQLRFAILENDTGTYNAPARTFAILESGNEVNNSSSDGFFAISTRRSAVVSEKFRITSTGNTIISGSLVTTSSISAYSTITATNTLYIQKGVGGYLSYITAEQTAASTGNAFKFWNSGGNTLLTITYDGNFGIGTTSTAQKLDVVGNIRCVPVSSAWAEGLSFSMPTTSSWGGLRWRRERANADGNHYIGYVGTDTTDDLVFGSNNAGTQIDNNIRITKAGLVGVGTSSPAAKFHVVGVISGSSFSGAGTGLTGTAASLTVGTATNATQLGGVAAASYVTLTGTQTLTNKTITGTFTGALTGNASTATALTSMNISQFTNNSLYQYHRSDITSLSSSATNVVQPLGTFDGSNITNAPTSGWYNYLSSTHGSYLTSLIANLHRTSDWYVGYKEGPGGTPTNPSWFKLLHSGNYSSYTNLTASWATNAVTALNVGNGTITIAAGTGVGVGTTNTFTTNQSGATTVTISNSGVTSNVAGSGISVSGATGAVTITNSGVTSAVAGTGVGVSAATGAVTFSIGQAVGTGNSPTFAGLVSNGNVGIGTSSPSSKLHVVETTATGSRIQLGSTSTNALMNTNLVNDFLILTAPFNAVPATTSNNNAKWGIKMGGGSTDAPNISGKSACIYAVSEEDIGAGGSGAGYNRKVGLALHTSPFDLPNVERVRINNLGNVGIGTTTPATKLDVYGPVSLRGTTVLTTNFDLNAGNANDIYGNIRVLRGASLNDGMYIGYGGAGGNLKFFSNSGTTEFMTIATTGNVGIGSTSPAYKLDVNGTFNATGTSTLAGVSITGTINSSATEAVRVNNNSGYISFYNTAGNSRTGYIQGLTGGSLTLSAENGALLQFLVGGTERLRIDTSGNVGIGTTSVNARVESYYSSNAITFNYLATNLNNNSPIPVYGFDVTNGVGETRSIKAGIGYERHLTNGRGTLHFYNDSTNDTQSLAGNRTTAGDIKMSLDNSGNLGIGTTQPSWLLTVYAASAPQFTLQNGTRSFVLTNNAGDNLLSFNYGSINRLQFDTTNQWFNTGNLGVGNTSPQYKLHVTQATPSGQRAAPANTSIQVDSNTNNYISLVNTADNGTYAGLTFVDNNIGGYIVFRNYTGDVTTGSDSLIYGTFQDHIFQNSSSETINGKTETMRIKQNGNVGIGSNNPQSKLDVNGVLAFGGVAVLNTANNGNDIYANVRVIRNTSSTSADGMYINYDSAGTTAAHLRFYANAGNERMRIQANDGNVGIGTTSAGRRLDVEGIVRTRGASGSGGFEIGAATTGAAKWRIEWDSASDSLDFNWVG